MRLETRLGKRVVVMSQDPDNAIADRGFRVVGVFKAELESREESIVFAGRNTIQEMLGIGSEVSEIALLGHDYHAPGQLAAAIRGVVPEDREVLSWQELDPYLATMMKVMDGFLKASFAASTDFSGPVIWIG